MKKIRFFTQTEKSCVFCGNDGNYDPNACECFVSDKYNAITGFSTSAISDSMNWWSDRYGEKRQDSSF